MMKYAIKRSNRKSISIYVTKEANVEVHAPYFVSKTQLDEIVQQKQAWILTHLAIQKEQKTRREEFALKEGSPVLLWGQTYCIAETRQKEIFIKSPFLYLPKGEGVEKKEQMIDFYKKTAKEFLPERVKYYAEHMKVAYKSVQITSAKTRWGSCSGDNRLHFTWRLMMANRMAIDYVVVHELAHGKEHNHSAAFWDIVQRYYPFYEKAQEDLKQLALQLRTQDW